MIDSVKIILAIAILGLTACEAAEIERICEPSKERQFNVVYNAHFRGDLNFNNLCGDTALVLYTVTDSDPAQSVVPPNEFYTLNLRAGQQYLVNVPCADSTLTYTYVNQCP